MTKEEVKLVENIIRHTTAFGLRQIEYELTGSTVLVWSTASMNDCFHATEVIPLFIHPFSTYVTYDSTKEKCVLVIF